MSLIKPIKNLISTLYTQFKSLHSHLYLEELNLPQKSAILRIRGSRSTLNLSIAEAVTDPLIISNLIPTQACWLGYYAGQLYDKFSTEKKSLFFNKCKEATFKLHFKSGRYKIVSQLRNGSIEYADIRTNQTHEDLPMNILRNQSLISNFDPSQACYIGVLASTTLTKPIQQTPTKTILRVIK